MKLTTLLFYLFLQCASFSSFAQAPEKNSWAAPRANFSTADANADERLSAGEFKQFINANADAGFSKAKKIRRFGAYSRAFRKLDSNSDDFVDWHEFEAAQK